MKLKLGSKILIFIIVLVLFITVTILLINKNLTPLLTAESKVKGEQYAVKAMNDGVSLATFNKTEYLDLIDIVSNDKGEVMYLKARTPALNNLALEAVTAAQKYLDELGAQKIYINIGNLTGVDWFSGLGPEMAFQVKPVGAVNAQYVSEFENAGINQTRHSIKLLMTCNVAVILPSGSTEFTVEVINVMSEAIIVGTVPSTYLIMDGVSTPIEGLSK